MLSCSVSRFHITVLAGNAAWLFTAVHRDCTASSAWVACSISTPLNTGVECPLDTWLRFHQPAQLHEYGLVAGR